MSSSHSSGSSGYGRFEAGHRKPLNRRWQPGRLVFAVNSGLVGGMWALGPGLSSTSTGMMPSGLSLEPSNELESISRATP